MATMPGCVAARGSARASARKALHLGCAGELAAQDHFHGHNAAETHLTAPYTRRPCAARDFFFDQFVITERRE
jgi:hypothetical protein